MFSTEEIKKKLAIYTADFVKQGMRIGMGTGSTVYWLIRELAQRHAEGLNITIVPTSESTTEIVYKSGIAIAELDSGLVLTIDGADEIDPKGQLIKGGGGALLREKIVANASDELIIMADHSKLVDKLGKFPLPIEVTKFGFKQTKHELEQIGFCKQINLRAKNKEPFTTDNGNYIFDCTGSEIDDPKTLNEQLHSIPGVVETGLFVNMTSKAIIGYANGRVEVKNYRHL